MLTFAALVEGPPFIVRQIPGYTKSEKIAPYPTHLRLVLPETGAVSPRKAVKAKKKLYPLLCSGRWTTLPGYLSYFRLQTSGWVVLTSTSQGTTFSISASSCISDSRSWIWLNWGTVRTRRVENYGRQTSVLKLSIFKTSASLIFGRKVSLKSSMDW